MSVTTASETGSRRRLLLIGLDSASPEYLFDRCRPVMPNLARVISAGVRGPLRTTDPPISIPAWPVMFTGVDPGTLGLYGFRHRLNHSYHQTYGPASNTLPVPPMWQIYSERGRRVCVIGMPPSYPPPPVNGISISDFLTPAGAQDTTHPPELAAELDRRFGPYVFDVTFRASERAQLYHEIVTMTQRRFAVAEELFQREPWDLFAIHEVGTDRLHHAYTKYFDPKHRAYEPNNSFEHVLLDYYRIIDQCVGRLLAISGPEVIVGVLSDHGSMPMEGCFCINQWLADEGFLSVPTELERGTPLEKAGVRWSSTRAWGAGGYYARIFFNVKGRDPQGIVAPGELPALRADLESRLAKLRRPDGTPFPVRILDPEQLYHEVRGDPPDLMVYFDELRWRSAGTMGHPTNFLDENDTGPDDAVHAMNGVYLWFDPLRPDEREGGPLEMVDVLPTLLDYVGEALPKHLQGKVVRSVMPGGGPLSARGPGGAADQS
ncbi:MAG: alkaline phosphatase family protein [Thermoplasmata archaeon]|nr:alkaline phosphatase family protein [Thermoplasmata archaeon]